MNFSFFKDKTLIGKILFSIYNVLSIILLNFFVSAESAGNFLYFSSQILLVATFSRLGSDFYWASSETPKKIRIVNTELITHSLINIVVSLIFNATIYTGNITDFFLILMAIVSSNFMQIMGRHFQKHDKHVISLFLFTVGPIGVSVPLLILIDGLPIMAIIVISNLSICLPFLFNFLSHVEFEIEEGTFLKRLSFMPMLAFGICNQHLITQLSGLNAREADIAMLVLVQRISGLISWPMVLFMQTNLLQLNKSSKSQDLFVLNIKKYFIKYSPVLALLTTISILSSVIFIHFDSGLSYTEFFAILAITLGSLTNAMFAFVQYQMGVKGMITELSLIILFSLLVAVSCYYILNGSIISASVSFLIFHLLTHSISTVSLARKISKGQEVS